MTTGKAIALTLWTFVSKVMSLLFNMQSTLVIAFLLRSKLLLISWLQSPSAMILEPRKIKSLTVSIVFPSFRIWNSSAGIPSPPLALVVVMLPKAHVTLYSRMSVSKWVITQSWFPGSLRSLLCISYVYSCHLFLISSGSVRSIPFLSFIVPTFAWNVPLVTDFLEELSSLSHSVVFFYFFALIMEEGFLLSPCYSLQLCIQLGISFLFSFVFSFSSFLSHL